MCVRYAFRLIVIAAVLFCLWYSLKNNISQQLTCDGLPSPLYTHPVHSTADSPPVSREPRGAFTPRIRLLPHSLCDGNTTVMFVFHSDVRNTVQRQFQRKQLDDSWIKMLNARRIFVVGSTVEPTDKIEKEAEKYNDIVQVDTIDHYHNITYKAQAWIQLLSTCPETPTFIIKLDDDVMVDRVGVEYLIYRYGTSRRTVGCRVLSHGSVVRNPESKWYLSPKEFSGSDLGTYCQGMAYVFSGDQLRYMRENIPRVQFLWMDDWYVTRALLSGSTITLLDLSDHYCSTNSDEELDVWMTNKKLLRIPQRTIFGHFRPAEKFPLKRSILQWKEITALNDRCT
uniref:Hexosyltransferase n=1 Tax=Haemonchus contortus TaxID=6289 RepID=A0A7I4YG29_HAECO|nr:Glycosyl transferase domain containing protein [Haemonchus contortus]